MRNLAGVDDADIWCAIELTKAGIEGKILRMPQDGEVRTRVEGHIGNITLRRAWYYWVARGKVPLAIAERLYANPIGRRDVRVNGHCGCPAPGKPGGDVEWHDADGEVFVDPDGSREAAFGAFIARYAFLTTKDKPRFVKSTEGLRAYVTCYHIDSQEGLDLFARTMGETT